MKTHYIQQGTIKEYGQPLKKTSMFNLNTWFKRMLSYFNVPYVDDCCDDPVEWPVRVIEGERNGVHQLQHYNPVTDSWDNFDPTVSYLSGTTAFNINIPFNYLHTLMTSHTLVANLIFTSTVQLIQGGVTSVKVTGDGASTVTFDATIHEISTSAGFDNTLGMENFLVFFYDGGQVFVNVYQ